MIDLRILDDVFQASLKKLSLQLCFVLQYMFRPQRVALASEQKTGILFILRAGTAQASMCCSEMEKLCSFEKRKQVLLRSLSE